MPIDPEPSTDDPLRAEEFDALVRELLPTIRERSPAVSPLEALREASRLADAMLAGNLHPLPHSPHE